MPSGSGVVLVNLWKTFLNVEFEQSVTATIAISHVCFSSVDLFAFCSFLGPFCRSWCEFTPIFPSCQMIASLVLFNCRWAPLVRSSVSVLWSLIVLFEDIYYLWRSAFCFHSSSHSSCFRFIFTMTPSININFNYSGHFSSSSFWNRMCFLIILLYKFISSSQFHVSFYQF